MAMTALPRVTTADHLEDARRRLMDAVRDLALANHFSRATLKLAEALAPRSKAWRKPLAWFQIEDGSQTQALQCEAIDADGACQCVTVYLYPLFGQITLDSGCTCGQSRCPHAAGMLIRLQQSLDWPTPMTPLQRWQRSIATLKEPASRNEADTDHSAAPWQVLCLVKLDGDPTMASLVARWVAVGPGSGARPEVERWLPIEDPRAQSHLSQQALIWLARLNAVQRKQRAGDSYLLRDENGAALLHDCLRAGVCRHAVTMQPLHPGEARDPHWQWSHGVQGEAKITLHWSGDRDVRLFELDGLRYLDLSSGELGKLRLSRMAWDIVQQMPAISPAEATAFMRDWPPHPLLAALPPPPAPPPIQRLKTPLRCVAVLGASRHAARGDHVFHVRAFADYGGNRLPLAEEVFRQEAIRRAGGDYIAIHRDIEREVAAWRALEKADLVSLNSLAPDARRLLTPVPDAKALAHRAYWQGGAETFTALESALQALGNAGFLLEYDPELAFTVLPPETKLKATLDPGKHPELSQFQLAAEIDSEEIDVLPLVLGGLARRAFSLTPSPDEPSDAHWLAPVGNQRWLPLPLAHLREWMAPLVECLDRAGDGECRSLQLTRSQTLALTECLQQQGIEVDGSQAADAAETLAALRVAAESTITVEVPSTFCGSLRHYQHEGLQWLQALRQSRLGGVLADDMGLGKTVQIIAHLLVEQEAGRLDHPALVVAPTSLVFNWLDEIARFAPTLACVNYTGPNRANLRERLPQVDVIITSYALLANELEQLESRDYALLVLDEAQWIKNPLTQAARAVRRLHAAHRLVATGTPLENHLGELWAHFDAVMPGYLGDYRSFNRSFRQPIEQHEDDARRSILRRRIAPFLLRRSKASVAPELPAKTETVLRVSMGESQRRLYESLRLAQSERVREALASYRQEQSRIIVLSALLRLRQVCCDPRLIENLDDPPPSAKLEALLELVQSLREEDRQILIFSQFTSMLALISRALDDAHLDHVVLTGNTADRATPVRRFQSGASPILLASLKAGGVGLNLTAADAVIHYDPWWNPAAETQAADRAHRLGREHPVFVYKLLCDDTIEERIESMKTHKSDLADAMLGDTATPLSRMGDNELRALFDLASAA
jgi:superfamily II DNA or RNA helicase